VTSAEARRRLLRAVIALTPTAASLHSPPALAAVIDDIAIERSDPAPRVRLRLTSPVHFLRYYSSEQGRIVYVQLQALAPENFGTPPFPDEVKRSPNSALFPRFTVRVSLDPRCDPSPHAVCMTFQFERAIRARARLGEDRRSLLLDVESEGEGGSPTVREKP
jgi:hypothetical protein